MECASGRRLAEARWRGSRGVNEHEVGRLAGGSVGGWESRPGRGVRAQTGTGFVWC